MIYTFTANPSLDKLLFVKELSVGKYNWGEVKQYDPAGKGINVSRCLQSLGIENMVLGFFAGSTGDYLIQSLRQQGFAIDPIMIEGENRSNVTLVESASGRMTKLNEYGPVVSAEACHLALEKITEKTKSGDIWIISGSALPGLPDNFYALMIETIRKYGGKTYLDSSGKWLLHGYPAAPDLLRINKLEAGAALDKELATRAQVYKAIGAFRRKGIPNIVISMGRLGAVFFDSTSLYDVTAPEVQEKTSIGAGDAMMAMITYGHLKNWPLSKIAAWGVAAGSASVMQTGTATITLDQVAPLVDKVRVEEIECALAQ